jgi:pimeloyl-ACP methyl ester carboxylesterase
VILLDRVERRSFKEGPLSLVVCVHGVAQQSKGEEVLLREWAPALRDGLRRARDAGKAALDLLGDGGIRCAFYGDLYRPPGRPLGVGDPFLTAEDATEYDAELLMAWWEVAAETDPGVVRPDARVLARTPRTIQAALRALSGSRFFANVADRALLFDLAQVRRYFTERDLRAAILARIETAVETDSQVIVAHSLGSVVAYEALAAHPEWPIHTLITLGSPLGIRNLIFERLITEPLPLQGKLLAGGHYPPCPQRMSPPWCRSSSRCSGPPLQCFLVDTGALGHGVPRYLTAGGDPLRLGTAVTMTRPRATLVTAGERP